MFYSGFTIKSFFIQLIGHYKFSTIYNITRPNAAIKKFIRLTDDFAGEVAEMMLMIFLLPE